MSTTTTKEISVGDIGARAAAHSDNERMALNVGPSHPTTHGVLRLMMELDGDVITKCDPVLGYLHRGDEKIAENMTYNQFVPYTDRLDYLAPLANNVAYALTVENLAGIEVPAIVRRSGTGLRDGPDFQSSSGYGGFWNGCGCMDSLYVHLHRA